LVRVTGHLKEMMIACLSDPESRRMIRTVMVKPKSAVEIETELHLPQSTFYRKLSELKECGLLMVGEYAVKPDGRREPLYACSFTEVRFRAGREEMELELVETKESLEKKWFALFFSKQDPC